MATASKKWNWWFPKKPKRRKNHLKKGTRKFISDCLKQLSEAKREKKFLFILLFSAAFSQIHRAAFLFPKSNKWLGITLENWHSWQTAVGIAFFVGSGVLLALFLIIVLPRSLPRRYFLPLAIIVLVNGMELINIFLDRPYTHEGAFFNPWYTLLPLALVGAFLFRSLLQTAPSEQNRYLRRKIDRLRKEHLVEIFDRILTFKYSSAAIEASHDLESWKTVLKRLSDEGIDEVVEAIKMIEKEG